MSMRIISQFSTGIGRKTDISVREQEAIKELNRRILNGPVTSKQADNALKMRLWATAPIVEVTGNVPGSFWSRETKRGFKLNKDPIDLLPSVKIRWSSFENRDIDIVLNENEALYSAEVKSILYGIVMAIHWNEHKIRMKSTNEVVVKVANGKYKANAEKLRFDLIKKAIHINSKRYQVKLEKSVEEEKVIRSLMSIERIKEIEFFEKYKNSIEILKNL